MFNNKKADGNIFWILIIAFLAIVVGAIILLFAKPAIEKGFGVATTQLGSLDDFDGDKVANFFDACPCIISGTVEDSQLQGCPQGTTAEQSLQDKKNFKESACPETAPMAGEQEQGVTTLKIFDGEQAVSSGATISSDSIRYEVTCAAQCTLEVQYPTNTRHEITTFNQENQDAGELDLPDLGTYFLIVKENNQEKIQFRIEKE